jgi:hypothetical protein
VNSSAVPSVVVALEFPLGSAPLRRMGAAGSVPTHKAAGSVHCARRVVRLEDIGEVMLDNILLAYMGEVMLDEQ